MIFWHLPTEENVWQLYEQQHHDIFLRSFSPLYLHHVLYHLSFSPFFPASCQYTPQFSTILPCALALFTIVSNHSSISHCIIYLSFSPFFRAPCHYLPQLSIPLRFIIFIHFTLFVRTPCSHSRFFCLLLTRLWSYSSFRFDIIFPLLSIFFISFILILFPLMEYKICVTWQPSKKL